MEPGTFAQDFFCRLCAAEGIVIHPLFPPGDNDPKDELVRMIEVLTSVHLAQAEDAGAVICDKCLQMLDLFCKFREECLRQDVLIRTRRTLLAEQLARQRQQQRALFAQQELAAVQSPPVVEVKMEEALPVTVDKQQEVICIRTQQLRDTEDLKEESEADEPENGQQMLVASEPLPLEMESPPLLQSPDMSRETILNSSLNDAFTPLSSTALISSTDSVTISVSDTATISPFSARRIKTKSRTNHKEQAPASEQSQESLSPYNECDQQLHRQQHAWEKANRCSLACDPCQMRFTKSYNLKRHMYEVHGEVPQGLTVIPCVHCGERFLRGNILERHIAKMHQNKNKLKVCAIQLT